MAITLSTDVGRALTPAEIDANFQFVDQEARSQKDQADSSASAAAASAEQALAAAQTAATSAAAQAVSNVLGALGASVNTGLLQWAYAQAFRLVSGTRDTKGELTTGNIVWPDGATGVWVTDSVDPVSGAINSWHATYVNGLVTKTVTQPAVTRDANGGLIAQPEIVIT